MKWMMAGGAGIVIALVMGVVLGAAMTASGSSACGTAVGQIDITKIPADATVGSYDAEKLINAAHVMNAASTMKLDVKAQRIGVMTALGESGLRNVDWGDGAINPDGTVADSIGLFQQQSSWGSSADRMNPEKAASLFFTRLVAVDGWETLDPSLAAHKVQINADIELPDGTIVLAENYYTQFWQTAIDITDYLARTGSSAGATSCSTGEAAYPLAQPYLMSDDFGPREAPTEGASSWHPAIDLNGHCGDSIYAVLPGKVTLSDRLYLSIQSPDGFTISYLHSHLSDRLVNVGDEVKTGQEISKVGDESPATGCHLDIRINVADNKNPKVAELPTYPEAPNYVDPEKFLALFGLEVCPAEWCSRNY